MEDNVTVLGADWCRDTRRTLEWLGEWNIPHRYVNVDSDPMAEMEVSDLNHGQPKLPTLVLEGNGTRVLSVPNQDELLQALAETELMPQQAPQG
jgi:mycoredoxin